MHILFQITGTSRSTGAISLFSAKDISDRKMCIITKIEQSLSKFSGINKIISDIWINYSLFFMPKPSCLVYPLFSGEFYGWTENQWGNIPREERVKGNPQCACERTYFIFKCFLSSICVWLKSIWQLLEEKLATPFLMCFCLFFTGNPSYEGEHILGLCHLHGAWGEGNFFPFWITSTDLS